MNHVAFIDGDIEVPAELIAEGLGLPVAELPGLLRSGAITSRCERGVDEDAGRHRLTFFHSGRRLRLVVGDDGRVMRQMVIDVGDRPLPAALRRP